jgi:hypothetical protein
MAWNYQQLGSGNGMERISTRLCWMSFSRTGHGIEQPVHRYIQLQLLWNLNATRLQMPACTLRNAIRSSVACRCINLRMSRTIGLSQTITCGRPTDQRCIASSSRANHDRPVSVFGGICEWPVRLTALAVCGPAANSASCYWLAVGRNGSACNLRPRLPAATHPPKKPVVVSVISSAVLLLCCCCA